MKWDKKQQLRTVGEKVLRFLDKQGFYIVLVVCLLAIGGVAIWASSARNAQVASKSPDDVTDVIMQPEDDPWPAEANADPEAADVVIDLASRTFEAATSSRTPAKTSSNDDGSTATSQTVVAMLAPTTGEMGMTFAHDQLVYSKTLKQFTTHVGVDIAATEGDPVRASLSGTVELVQQDPLLGYMVVLAHANDTKTVYGSLQEVGLPAVGDKVERGDTIGLVGNTAVAEIEEGTHLHFEVHQGGAPIDPSVFFASGDQD